MRDRPPQPNPLRPLALWRVELLGGLRAISGSTVLTQFGSRRIGALLARLALAPQRLHAREELADLIWPEADPAAARNRLRHALSTLKRLLHPPGAGDVLLADRAGVRLNPEAVRCDALEFERLARAGRSAEARSLYRGELLPGYYDDWIQDERERLAAIFDRLDAAADASCPADAAIGPKRLWPGGGRAGGEADALAGARNAAAARGPASDRADELPAAPGASLDSGLPAAPGVGATLFPTRQVLLPSYLSAFFGRGDELAELGARVLERRLVTVCGAGGCGKTRLAVEVARRLSGRFELLLFVPLAEVVRPELVCESICQALRLPVAGREAEAQLIDYLTERAALLVLDNFEQLVAPGGAEVVERLLATLPRLHCLVTSRRALGIGGEFEYDVRPLPLPGAHASTAELAANAGAALFVDRARSVRADVQITAANRADLSQLLRALEGVPLAIELAASRIRAMSVAEMAREIGRRRDWIARGNPKSAREPRHASLQAAIDWSWRLLTPAQQRLLCDLTAFRGGFGAEAAASVGDADDGGLTLDSLVADSLLQTHTDAWGRTRFTMLELIREFVGARAQPSQLLPARARHRRYFRDKLARFARADPARLAPEQANVEEALATALADGAAGEALDLALALRPLADARGLGPRLVELVAAAVEAATEGDERACRGHMLLAEANTVACRLDAALDHAERALASATGSLARAEAVFIHARVCWERNLTALEHKRALQQALAVACDAGAAHLQARVLNLLGNIATQDERDYTTAEALFAHSAELAQSAGLHRLATQARHNLGIVCRKRRRFDAAAASSETVIDDCRRRGDTVQLADALHERGLMRAEMRRWRQAVAAFGECIDFCWEHRALLTLAYALWNLARPLARTGRAADAARLAGFAAAYWEQHGGPLSRPDRRYVARVQRLAAAQCGAAASAAALRDGAVLGLPQAVELARAACVATAEAEAG